LGDVDGGVTILSGWEWVPGNSSGAYIGVGGWKLLLHTTEGASVAGAVAAYRTNNSWPHFTVSPKERRRVQHLHLEGAARALRNQPGGVETNRARVIQVEIVGFAGQMPGYFTAAEWDWLRVQVLDPIFAAWPMIARVPVDGFHAYPPPMRLGSEPWRMSGPNWLAFSGVVGHQHAPENFHGDPGAIPIDLLLGDDMPLTDSDVAKIWGFQPNAHGHSNSAGRVILETRQGVVPHYQVGDPRFVVQSAIVPVIVDAIKKLGTELGVELTELDEAVAAIESGDGLTYEEAVAAAEEGANLAEDS
jgi:hypothetical protein